MTYNNTFVKICGITLEDDAQYAIDQGVDALGFIAYPKSPRYVSPARFNELREFINGRVTTVVVVVNPTDDELKAYCDMGADIIQFHGNEPIEQINNTPLPCWKAFNIRSKQQVDELSTRPIDCSRYLIDSFVKDAAIPGGTGHQADWDLSRYAIEVLPKPVLLAGGISPENIEEAFRTVHPAGFDISSSIEDSPGRKNHDRIAELFKALKSLK